MSAEVLGDMKKKRSFTFSWKISLIGVVLIVGMLRLSYWQWNRYLEKQAFLTELDRRLETPIVPIGELLKELEKGDLELSELLHRRVSVRGSYDFKHEFVKRNRKDEIDGPGVHIITPLKLKNSEKHILVNRGYIPLSVKEPEARKQFQKNGEASFVALLKLTEEPRSFLSPNDPPTGEGKTWVDAWLRVDIARIQKQMPFTLLPVHLELMSGNSKEEIEEALIKNSNARNEIFYLSDSQQRVSTGELNPDREYPVPAFSTVVPSATHLLYVFEWAFMALLTFVICLGLQLRRRSQTP